MPDRRTRPALDELLDATDDPELAAALGRLVALGEAPDNATRHEHLTRAVGVRLASSDRRAVVRAAQWRAAVASVAAATLVFGLGSAGALPDPAQRAISNAAGIIGVHLPDGGAASPAEQPGDDVDAPAHTHTTPDRVEATTPSSLDDDAGERELEGGPVDQADPTDQAETTDTTDQADKANKADKGDKTERTERATPPSGEPADPATPAAPTEPGSPAEPDSPAEPSSPAEPGRPAEPGSPAQPEPPADDRPQPPEQRAETPAGSAPTSPASGTDRREPEPRATPPAPDGPSSSSTRGGAAPSPEQAPPSAGANG